MKKNGEKIYEKFFLNINVLLTIFYLLWCMTPYVSRKVPNTIMLILIFLWGISAFFSINIRKLKVTKLTLLVSFWSCVLVVYFLLKRDNVAIGNLFNIMLYFFSYYIFIFYMYIGEKEYIKRFINFIIIMLIITGISSINILIKDPYASKYLTGSVPESIEMYSKTNLVTVTYIIAIVVLMPILFGLFRYSKNRFEKGLIFFSILIGIILCVLAGSSISLIVLVIECVFIVLFNIKNRYLRYISFCFFIIILLLIILFKRDIGIFLINSSSYIKNISYSTRVNEIGEILLKNVTSGSFTDRIHNTLISFNTFLNNPLLGSGMIYSADINLGIGMHSQIIDDLARYGVFGIIFTVNIYYNFYIKFIRKAISLKRLKYIIASIIGAIVMSILNPTVGPQLGLDIFLIMPYYINKSIEKGADIDEDIICSK